MDIQGKVVVITGASGGIGLSTARRFAAAGAKVVLAARTVDQLEQTAQEMTQQGHEAIAVPADMRNRKQVNRMVETAVQQFGTIDVLVNNAGQSVAGTIEDLNIDDYQQIIELNLYGVLYAMQAVIPVMREHDGGLILNISSMVSKMHIPGLAGYASTKAALNLLSETARGELEPDNIRVITVFPRMTATNFGKNALGNQQIRQRQRQGGGNMVVDPPEHVAEKILEAAQKEPAEQYMEER